MRLWICDTCGAMERLTFAPERCVACGGSMSTQDERSICGTDARDPATLIRKWQCGFSLSANEQSLIDDFLLQNRVSLLSASFPSQEAA